MLDAGPTNPHTSLHLSGGLLVQRQVAGTNGEAPTSVGASICLAVSVGGLVRFFTYNVAYWPKADIPIAWANVRFRG